MNDQERIAIAAFAQDLSDALGRLAKALGGAGDGRTAEGAALYGPAHAKLHWNERVLRQSLIIQDILDGGGSVPRTQWYDIAAKYGYIGRGTAGFFRSDGTGLLTMRNNRVTVTKHGKERLAQNQERVNAERERLTHGVRRRRA